MRNARLTRSVQLKLKQRCSLHWSDQQKYHHAQVSMGPHSCGFEAVVASWLPQKVDAVMVITGSHSSWAEALAASWRRLLRGFRRPSWRGNLVGVRSVSSRVELAEVLDVLRI